VKTCSTQFIVACCVEICWLQVTLVLIDWLSFPLSTGDWTQGLVRKALNRLNHAPSPFAFSLDFR
jgi:hypothetical protein